MAFQAVALARKKFKVAIPESETEALEKEKLEINKSIKEKEKKVEIKKSIEKEEKLEIQKLIKAKEKQQRAQKNKTYEKENSSRFPQTENPVPSASSHLSERKESESLENKIRSSLRRAESAQDFEESVLHTSHPDNKISELELTSFEFRLRASMKRDAEKNEPGSVMRSVSRSQERSPSLENSFCHTIPKIQPASHSPRQNIDLHPSLTPSSTKPPRVKPWLGT